MAVWEQFVQVWRGVFKTFVDATPQVVGGVLVFAVMLAVAKLAEWLLRLILVQLRLDSWLAQSGLDRTLQRLGIRQPVTQLLPRLAYFLLLLLFAQTTADVFGLHAISNAIRSLFDYLPNALAALVVLAVGSIVSQVVSRMIAQASEEAGLDFGGALGRVVGGLILFVAGVMAVSQLQVDTRMVQLVTTCALAGGALAFGLSFGLGSREFTRNIIAGFYARKVFNPGDGVEVLGVRGIIAAITPTQTLLQDGDDIVAIANSALVTDVVRAHLEEPDEPPTP